MPPKKKAKKTQTASLDKRAQAKMLRDKASAFEAEATVEERIYELLEPAKVSANTFLLKVFDEKAEDTYLSHKKKAYLDAGFAIKECEHKITSGEDVMKLKGVGKSSASLIDRAIEEASLAGVAEKFFTVMNSKGVREAVASLPKDAEITVDSDGVLRVNGKINGYFLARGCPFELTLGVETWVVNGSVIYYDWPGDDWAGEFEGTLTTKKNTKGFPPESIPLNYITGYSSTPDFEDKGFSDEFKTYDFDEDEKEKIREALEDKVFSLYEWSHVKE